MLIALGLSASRLSAWRRAARGCELADAESCPGFSPHALTQREIDAIEDMVTAPAYGHVPTGRLTLLAQRLGRAFASPSTWHRLVKRFGWRRPRLRLHPGKPRENVNGSVDSLIEQGALRRILALVEVCFSNSLIEAWWRSLKHNWLFLHQLDSVAPVRRHVAFYVQVHNSTIPHSAFRGQTPDEMYFERGDGVPGRLAEARALARERRREENRARQCVVCA
jgi:hypothetical protein